MASAGRCAAAGALLVAILGCGGGGDRDGDGRGRHDLEEMGRQPPTERQGCQTEPADAADLPDDVAAWSDGSPIAGADPLWAAIPAADWIEEVDPAANNGFRFSLKLAWYRGVDGELSVVVTRVDGDGASSVDIPDGYGPTGFQPSGIHFDSSGCWRVDGHVGDATTTVFVEV